MSVLPSCIEEGDSIPAAPPTCGAWLTMRRRAEYEQRVRHLEDASLPTTTQCGTKALPQIAAQ